MKIKKKNTYRRSFVTLWASRTLEKTKTKPQVKVWTIDCTDMLPILSYVSFLLNLLVILEDQEALWDQQDLGCPRGTNSIKFN